MTAVRVVLPGHLRTLAHVGAEVSLDVAEPLTLGAVARRASSTAYPMLRGTIRDQATASGDRSCASSPASRTCRTSRRTTPLPDAVVAGAEPFLVVGAMAGG